MKIVSVVICTFNRAKYLPICLENLKNQNENKEKFEIIIVNNNSTDETETICLNFIKDNPDLSVNYVLEKLPGLSNARNRGIIESKGELIAFIDDDGFAKPNYVSILTQIIENNEFKDFIAFGGRVEPVYNEGKSPNWLSKYIDGVVSKVDLGDTIKPFNKKYPAGCNMVFRRIFFEQNGNFNTDLHTRGDDKYIFDKLKKLNFKILYIPKLYVEHFIDDYRIEKSFIIKLSKIIGQSERIRLKDHSFTNKIIKLFEYLFKFFISLVIALIFTLEFKFSKAKYIILVRWYVLYGYFILKKL